MTADQQVQSFSNDDLAYLSRLSSPHVMCIKGRKYRLGLSRIPGFCVGALLLVASPSAWATYAVGFVGPDYVILAADSRQISGDGRIDDTVCKIGVTRNNIGVTIVGQKSLPDGRRHILDFFGLAINSAKQAGVAFTAAQYFRHDAWDRFERLPTASKKSASGQFKVFAFFADVDKTPEIVVTDVILDPVTGKQINTSIRTHNQTWHTVSISDYGRTADLAIGLFNEPQTIEQNAASMETLVDRIMAANIAANIGGVPTVLILQRARKPRWWTRAPQCPDLN